MLRIILIDTGLLGLVTSPHRTEHRDECNAWMEAVLASGGRIIIPEVADYELRRELVRASKSKGLANLDAMVQRMEYLPITTGAMREAARLWAWARNNRQQTAPDLALDGDVILAAQCITLGIPDATVATYNVRHLSRFVPSDVWRNIAP